MDKNLVGAAGTYFVMCKLSLLGIHASCTFGNAKNVDILAATEDGSNAIAIQVKTTQWALRGRGRKTNKQPHHFEFPLGHKAAGLNLPNLFFVFVDLKTTYALNGNILPDCYILSSEEIYEYGKGWKDDVKWLRFHYDYQALIDSSLEKWDKITSVLMQDDPEVKTQ